MKKIIALVLGGILICQTAAAETVLSYYHNSIRCNTCHNMEKWTSETADSLPIKFTAVNTDEPENKHFLTDYGLYTKSVIVSDSESGKWKNLDKIWNYAGSETDFKAYVKKEVEDFIQGNK